MAASTNTRGVSSLAALGHGIARIGLHRRLLVWLYAVNILFAAVLVYPFRRLVAEISKTDLADAFVAGFDWGSFMDFWRQESARFNSLWYSALVLGLLYVVFNTFLAGGIVATLTAQHRVSFRRFVTGAGSFFGRYVRLFVLQTLALIGVFLAYKFGIVRVTDKLEGIATTDRAAFLWWVAGIAVAVLLGSFVLMVFDYAKVRAVVDRRRGMIRAAAGAFTFAVRRLRRTVTLFWINVFLLAAIFGLYLAVEDRFSNATTASMWGLFAVQQLFVVCRIWMKLSFFASQLVLYQSHAERGADA